MSSRIATETTANLAAIFAGRTVTADEVYNQIEMEYATARKLTRIGSYQQILPLLQYTYGVTTSYTGPNYTGQHLYTFPTVAA